VEEGAARRRRRNRHTRTPQARQEEEAPSEAHLPTQGPRHPQPHAHPRRVDGRTFPRVRVFGAASPAHVLARLAAVPLHVPAAPLNLADSCETHNPCDVSFSIVKPAVNRRRPRGASDVPTSRDQPSLSEVVEHQHPVRGRSLFGIAGWSRGRALRRTDRRLEANGARIRQRRKRHSKRQDPLDWI
jgi:hypothetical protein